MNVKTISQSELNELTSSKNEQYLNLYANLPTLMNKISKFKKISLNLIEDSSNSPLKFIAQTAQKRTFGINLSGKAFYDAEFFKAFPDNLTKSDQYVIMIDTIVANGIYYLLNFNKSKGEYYSDNFLILALIYQSAIIKKLINQIYAADTRNDIYNKTMIVLAYSLYRFLLGYQHDMAKVKGVDLLYNSELLKGTQWESRLNISLNMNNLVRNSKVKNTYDALYEAGLFMEFVTAKRFLQALGKTFDFRLIKAIFTSIKFSNQKDAIGYYCYKIIILSISDILQVWNQYNKFKALMNNEFRTARKVIESMIKDYAVVLNKLAFA